MDAKWKDVLALDLRTVREKLRYKKGWWWRLTHDVDRLDAEYRQFLYLIAANPGETVVPWSRDLDDFWHEHILDTTKYAKDCDRVLGSFIHHNPHVPKGTPKHTKASAATRRMYLAAFKDKAAKKRWAAGCGAGCSTDMPVVFCAGNSGSSGVHHGSGGEHGGGHHDAGGHGHGCGSHGGGHGCGGHGCGGHGCGGHGCASGH